MGKDLQGYDIEIVLISVQDTTFWKNFLKIKSLVKIFVTKYKTTTCMQDMKLLSLLYLKL